MKRYLQFSVATLCLMVALLIGFHLGHSLAEAQSPVPIAGFNSEGGDGNVVILDNGDCYYRRIDYLDGINPSFVPEQPVHYMGDMFSGVQVPTESSTIGGVKAKYK